MLHIVQLHLELHEFLFLQSLFLITFYRDIQKFQIPMFPFFELESTSQQLFLPIRLLAKNLY